MFQKMQKVICMKNLGKLIGAGAIFVAGYFVGFYEMKYKLMKCLVEGSLQKKTEEKSEEEEAQA